MTLRSKVDNSRRKYKLSAPQNDKNSLQQIVRNFTRELAALRKYVRRSRIPPRPFRTREQANPPLVFRKRRLKNASGKKSTCLLLKTGRDSFTFDSGE